MNDAAHPSRAAYEGRPAGERNGRGALSGSVDLHIDELRLDGFRAGDKYLIAEALQTELAHLLGQGGMTEILGQSNSVDRLDAGAIRVSAESRPGAVGREIARNIHRSLAAQPDR
jgi:hypothetical protein